VPASRWKPLAAITSSRAVACTLQSPPAGSPVDASGRHGPLNLARTSAVRSHDTTVSSLHREGACP